MHQHKFISENILFLTDTERKNLVDVCVGIENKKKRKPCGGRTYQLFVFIKFEFFFRFGSEFDVKHK